METWLSDFEKVTLQRRSNVSEKSIKSIHKDNRATKWDPKNEKYKSFSKVRFYNCGKMGHFSTECDKNPRLKKACFNCGFLKHVLTGCPYRMEGRDNKVTNIELKIENKFYSNGNYEWLHDNEIFSMTLSMLLDSVSPISFIKEKLLSPAANVVIDRNRSDY